MKSHVAGVLHMLNVHDILGDLLGPVVRHGQMIKWAIGEVWEGGQGDDG